jgi:thioredoxin reductase (NADPH)
MASLERLSLDGAEWMLGLADGDELRASAVIVATGAHPRPLGVPGEEALQGRGISHCATCDGPLFRGKTVGVVGAGDSGLQEALTLAGFASKVIVFEKADASPAQQVLQDRAAASSAIELRLGAEVVGLVGDGKLSGVRVGAAEVPLDGLFVYAGLDPSSSFLADVVDLDGGGHVPTDAMLATTRPGLFAAGDIRQGAPGHAIAAAGDGATAAAAAYRYLRGHAT